MFRPDKDTYYLDIALAVSKRSTCLKRHYGCIIVKDDVIIATGYNGSPRGATNCCDVYEKCPRADIPHNSGNYEGCSSVHAEQNAIIMANRADLIGATLYMVCEDMRKWKDHKGKECVTAWFEDRNPEPCPIWKMMLKNAGIKVIKTRSGEICL